MSKIIDGLYYSESHEYVKVEGDFGYIGITDYAQHELGNVVYVDMPEDPIMPPATEISSPSFMKMRRTKRLSAPMALRISVSFRLSIISMESEPTTLKVARIRMKVRMTYTAHFSECKIL